jgi:hypothetical protein
VSPSTEGSPSELLEARRPLPRTSIRLPREWKELSCKEPVLLAAWHPGEHRFAANLSVVREESRLNDGAGTRRRLLERAISGLSVLEVRDLPVAGAEGCSLVFTFDGNGERLRSHQWVRPDEDGVSVLTLTCRDGEAAKYADIFTAVAGSWSATA